jgi:hypothetical protein
VKCGNAEVILSLWNTTGSDYKPGCNFGKVQVLACTVDAANRKKRLRLCGNVHSGGGMKCKADRAMGQGKTR